MYCHFHKEQYWHVFMGRNATRYECLSCLRGMGYIIARDRISITARKPIADEEAQIVTPPSKAQMMAGR